MVSGKTKSRILQDCITSAGLSAKQQCSLTSKITVRKQARNEEVTANAKSVLECTWGMYRKAEMRSK